MPDPTDADAAQPPDAPEDFAARALRLTREDPDAAAPPAATPSPKEAVKAPEPPASKVPTELFKPVADTTKVDEPKSALDAIPDPDFKDAKRKAQWDEVKAKAKEFEKLSADNARKVEDGERRVKELEAMGYDTKALQAKLDAAQKERDDAMALVRQVNVDLDPEFRRIHIEGRQKLINNAKTLVTESGGEPSDIETTLNLQGRPRVEALSKIAEGLDHFQAGRLGRLIDELSALDEAAAAKRSNPDQYLESRKKEDEVRVAKEREEQGKVFNAAFDTAEQKLSKELEVLRKVDGFDEWNAEADAVRARAKEAWAKGVDHETAARKFIEAEAVQSYRKLFLEQQAETQKMAKENAEMKAELQSLHNRGPKLTGSTSTNKAGYVDFASRAHGLMDGSIPNT